MKNFEQFVEDVFMQCVHILQVLGGAPGEYGFGYNLANLLIFVVIQPTLIAFFFILWMRAERRNKALIKKLNQ
jgi:hypothetical protein